MTKIYVSFNNDGYTLLESLQNGSVAFYKSMQDLLDDKDSNVDGDRIAVFDIVETGTLKSNSVFVSDKKVTTKK